MLARVVYSARWMHVSRDGGRYLSKASVISILDQIVAIGGGSGNCIVCDTVCSASLLCREKWHGHFSWGINFEVRVPCMRACTSMSRGALRASLQRACTARSFFCKALLSVFRYMSTTAIAERTVPCSARITLRDRTSPPSSLRGACACAGAGRGPLGRTPTCHTGGAD